jgi:anti-sigma factor RsiW
VIPFSCREVVGLVTGYLEGSLPVDERVRFERHVAICPPCRGYLAKLRETLRLAGNLREEELDEDMRRALLATLGDWKRATGG